MQGKISLEMDDKNNSKNDKFNPFSVLAYTGPKYFCDRQNESKKLVAALENGRKITLISPRRMGKTGLIKHVFDQLNPKESISMYIDLDQTNCLAHFTQVLGEAVLKKIGRPTANKWKKVLAWFKALRPTLTANPITGAPEISIDVQPAMAEASLAELFGWLEQSKLPCYVAFDEFQVIANYPETKVESLLRSHIQHLTNVNFIFAGSQRHLMEEMFMAANRPFFQSTQMFPLYEIPEDAYFAFAQAHFERHRQTLLRETFATLYATVGGHTWYVQCVLNRLYQHRMKVIDEQALLTVIDEILTEYNETFRMYSKLLTSNQLALIRAVAREGKVKEVNGKDFLHGHNLGAGSSVRSALLALLDKELVLDNDDGYSVYDRFFGLWLRR